MAAERFGRGAVQLAAANAIFVVAAYATTTGIARILAPADFGGFGVVMSWVTVLTALLVKGLSTSIAREMARPEGDTALAWHAGRSLGFRLAVSFTAIGVGASPLIAIALGGKQLAPQIAIGSLGALTFGLNAVLLAWPIGLRRYDRQALAQLAYAFSRVGCVLIGGYYWGLTGAVVGYVLAPLISSLSLVMPRPKTQTSVQILRTRMLKMMVPISITSIAITGFFVADIFGLSAALGGTSKHVGIYVAYGTLAHVPFFLLQATSIAMVPTIVAAKNRQEQRVLIRETLTDTLVLLAGPTLLLVTSGDAAARLFFGAAYHYAHGVAAPLALATAAVTWLAGLVAVDVALSRMRGALILTSSGVLLLLTAAYLAPALATLLPPASAVSWVTLMVCGATLLASALRARIHYGALLEPQRAILGVVLAAGSASIPLLVNLVSRGDGQDLLRTALAAAAGTLWLALVLKLRLVQTSRGR